jgi:hypothetical protein
MNGVFLRNFPDDQREKLLAGVTERLTAHGIEDQKNGEIMISGTPMEFSVTVNGRKYLGRVGFRTFDSDLHHLLDRFSHWLIEMDRKARVTRLRPHGLNAREAIRLVMRSIPVSRGRAAKRRLSERCLQKRDTRIPSPPATRAQHRSGYALT